MIFKLQEGITSEESKFLRDPCVLTHPLGELLLTFLPCRLNTPYQEDHELLLCIYT